MCSALGRVGSISAPLIFIIGDFWEPLPFVLFGVLSIVGGLMALLLPETLGKNLPETIEEGEQFGKWVLNISVEWKMTIPYSAGLLTIVCSNDRKGSNQVYFSGSRLNYTLIPGPWHFYMALVQTDKTMCVYVELTQCLNMAAVTFSEVLPLTKYDQKRLVKIIRVHS